MEDGPDRVGGLDGVKEVVRDDHEDAECRDDGGWQPDEKRKRDHAPAESPEHGDDGDVVVEVELHDEAAEEDEVEKDEPEASSEEEAREVGFGTLPRERRAPVPVRRKKTGAQMLVTQRVK